MVRINQIVYEVMAPKQEEDHHNVDERNGEKIDNPPRRLGEIDDAR